MATYKVVHTEKLVGVYYVEADSCEEAREEFEYLATEGKIDFCDLEMIDSSDDISLCEG